MAPGSLGYLISGILMTNTTCKASVTLCLPGVVLGTPVVPFCPFYFEVSLSKLNSRKKGTLVIDGLLGNLVLWVQKAQGLNFSRTSGNKCSPPLNR